MILSTQPFQDETWDDVTEEYEYEKCIDCNESVVLSDSIVNQVGGSLCADCAADRGAT